MARFVEFTTRDGDQIWINPEQVICVLSGKHDGTLYAVVHCCDSESQWWVTETVAEVLAKLQGDPQPKPSKAVDDIAGWWIGPSGTVYYIIGRDYWGRWVYQVDGHHNLNTLTMSRMAEWTRDPNRKGWDQ